MVCSACGCNKVSRCLRITGALSIAFCAKCGSGRAASPPHRGALASLYNSSYYDLWERADQNNRTEALKRATFRRRLEDCAEWIPSGGSILDLGCATGFFLQEAEARGFRAFGVDISSAAIETCSLKMNRNRLYCGQFEDATFCENRTNQFDAIFMSDYLEHVPDPTGVVALTADRLHSGGAVVITTPNVQSLSRKVMGKHWPHFKIEHVSYFSPKGMARLLECAHLDIVATWPTIKALSIAYATRHFERYSNRWLTPWFSSWRRLLPESIVDAMMWIPTGELTLVGRKR
jgi:2-polyprenyl-3-methyl-5-hydroxy-6-metoxy-1,4-benzoquinol methylase